MEDVRKVFPRIDLDPFSCEEANKIIGAETILTKEDDAFNTPWPSAEYVFINPPRPVKGEPSTRNNTRRAWELAVDYVGGSILWVGFSIEQLATLQESVKYPLDYPTVILRNRIKFVGGRNNPSHANYITLLTNNSVLVGDFVTAFKNKGRIVGLSCFLENDRL
jgi:hypothetical protein